MQKIPSVSLSVNLGKRFNPSPSPVSVEIAVTDSKIMQSHNSPVGFNFTFPNNPVTNKDIISFNQKIPSVSLPVNLERGSTTSASMSPVSVEKAITDSILKQSQNLVVRSNFTLPNNLVRSIALKKFKQRTQSMNLPGNLEKRLNPSASLGPVGVAIPVTDSKIIQSQNSLAGFDFTFPNNPGTNTALSFGGGAIATGAPVQLIFWGSAWNQPTTSPSANDIINAVQNILAGPFMSGLLQYGINRSPYRGAIIVTSPEPPFIPDTFLDRDSNIEDIVNALINNGTFPEPDEDNGRNIYFVIMPPNTKYNSNRNIGGAHFYFSSGSLIDVDNVWCAWIGNGSIEQMTKVFGHELVETCTDPEDDGWTVDGEPDGLNEIGDICNMSVNKVNGVTLEAYWSKLDNACILPTEFSVKRFMLSKGFDPQGGIKAHVPANGSVKTMMGL